MKQEDGDCYSVSGCVFGGSLILGGGVMPIHDSSLGSPVTECFSGEGQRWLSRLSGRGGAPSLSRPSSTPLVGAALLAAGLMAGLGWQLWEDQRASPVAPGKQERLGLTCPGRKPN